MNNTVINIRVPENLKQNLELMALERNKSCSDLIREGLSNLVNNNSTNIDSSISSSVLDYKFQPQPIGVDLLQTLGFTELVFWIMDKQMNPECDESDQLYIQFIKLLNEIQGHKLFTKEIKREFKKISCELESYYYGVEFLGSRFKFAEQKNRHCFDFELFKNFMYNLRFDDKNKRFLHIK